MSTGMSFGGGFASGLASVLSQKRQQDQQNKDRQVANLWKGIGFLVDSGQVNDISDLQPQFDALTQLGAFGDPKAKRKAGELDPQAHVTNILGHIIRNSKGGVEGRGSDAGPMIGTTPLPSAIQPQGPTGPNDAGEMIPPTELPSTGLPPPAPTAPPRRTLMEIPLLSQEEMLNRKLDTEATQTLQRVKLVRERIFPALKAVDPNATLEDAFAVAGVRLPTDRVVSFQRVEGEVGGKPVKAIFDPRSGQYLDATTHEPLGSDFIPRSSTSSTSLGAGLEAAARQLFGKPAAQLTPDELTKAQGLATEQAAGRAGATTTARAEAGAKGPLTANQRFQALRDLQGDWRKAEAPEKEVKRQYDMMQIGLRRFGEGDKIGGSQAVITTFNKILDQNSVVRESEYARTPEGLGLLQRLEGMRERLMSGGAGVPQEELAAMVQTAKEFVDGMAEYNATERERITQAAKEAGLDPARVFGVAAVPVGGGSKQSAAPTAKKDANGNWVLPVP